MLINSTSSYKQKFIHWIFYDVVFEVATDDTSSGSSGNEAGDEMKGSDNENDENEGEVTEAQKKVAEAAGLADQVSFFVTSYVLLRLFMVKFHNFLVHLIQDISFIY